jgi:ribosomal-protein-alanine N-acetyltransferase
MTMVEIPRVIEIERLAYPSPWPPSAYRKELQDNDYASYIVARDLLVPSSESTPQPPVSPRRFPLSLLSGRPSPSTRPGLASIVGFAGLWLVVDQAHVTTIAVHPDYRGRGVGELMLARLIDIAYEKAVLSITLEVRVSNYVAQSLYRKYSFLEQGIRRKYYSDNREDALIMCTPLIHDPMYRQQFLRNKAALQARLGAEADPLPPGAPDTHTVGGQR